MKRSTPHIKERKYGPESSRFCLDVTANGVRDRKYFPNKTQANAALKAIKTKIAREGHNALIVSDSARIAAVEAEKALSKYEGATIGDAVRFYIKHLEALKTSIPINELVAKYLAYKAQDTHLSHEHIDDLTSRYARFCQDLGTRGTRELTVDDVQDWLFDLPLTALSKNNFRARLFALFKFAVKKKLMDKNPCSDIDLLKVKKPRIEIFTPDELRAVLTHADPELIPAIVIGCFSGVRTKERSLLEWKDIDIKRGTITVEDEDCKTAMNRTIKMEPCLQAWLAPYQGRTGAVFAGNDQKLCRQLRQTCEAAGLNKAPKNGCRHSFATYHVAKYENSEAVRAILGHKSVGQLYANYRAMGVKPDQAEQWFNIFPPKPADNVVAMTA